MITLQENDKFSIQITVGDRDNAGAGDGKLDVTIEASIRVPSLLGLTSPHVQQIGPFTENLPVDQVEALAAALTKGGISALPGVGGAVGWVVHAVAAAGHLKI